MKQLFISLLMVTVSLGLFAQTQTFENDDFDFKRNELKINLPLTIFISFPEITYERILQEDLSLGASVGVSLDKEQMPINFLFVPYARWFFGGNRRTMQKAGTGFFIELNGGLFTRQGSLESYSEFSNSGHYSTTINHNSDKSSFGAGLGLGIGWKYLTKNNWIGEVTYGGGRDFVNDSAYPHLGISIGKRF